jgi:hypothetical protein
MLRLQRVPKQPAIYRFLVVLGLIIVLWVASPWVSAKEKPKPKPQEWQINGILAALEDNSPNGQGFALDQLAEYDAKDLKRVLKQPQAIAQKAANILNDKTQDSDVRVRAASDLGNLGEAAKPFIPPAVLHTPVCCSNPLLGSHLKKSQCQFPCISHYQI